MSKKVINLNGLDKEKIMSPSEMKNTKGRLSLDTCDNFMCNGSCSTWDGWSGECFIIDPNYYYCQCRIMIWK